MRTPLLVCLLVPLLSTARGQSLEAVVREAVESSFKMPRNMRKALIPAGRSRPPPLCSINSSESYFNILFGLSVKKMTSLLVGRHVFVFRIFIYLPSFFAIKKLFLGYRGKGKEKIPLYQPGSHGNQRSQ